MKFYQTYVKYAILVNERKDTFSTAKVTQNQSFSNIAGVLIS